MGIGKGKAWLDFVTPFYPLFFHLLSFVFRLISIFYTAKFFTLNQKAKKWLLKSNPLLPARSSTLAAIPLSKFTLENGVKGHAAVPSGASTGEREACELRDGDKKTYCGKGTLTAVKNVNTKIAKKIIGMDPAKQTEVDDAMIALDGNRMLKNTLGANAILGVSMAVCCAAANDAKMPLYQYIAKLHGTKKLTLPCPMCNVINGGAHSSAPIDFQEFMIAPVGAKTFSKGLQMVTEIFHALKAVLKKAGFDTTVGDEGGFAPGVSIKPAKNKFGYEITGVMTLEKALDALKAATTNAGYKFGTDIKIALDVASSEFCDKNTKASSTKSSSTSTPSSPLKTVSTKLTGLAGRS